MKTKMKHTLLGVITVLAASTLFVTTSMADTTKTNDQNNNEQATYPYGMPGGMMGPGYGGYRGMGPGNMPYGGRGPGYMHQGGRGYGGMGPGMGYGGMGYGGMGYGGMGYGGMGMMGMGYGIMQGLDLNKEQRSKIRALMREQRSANCAVMNGMMDVRDELAAEYDKAQPNAKTIGKLYEKMQGMQRHMLERMVDMRNKMRGLLNKEQKEKFDQYSRGGMMGPGMMGPGYGGWGREE